MKFQVIQSPWCNAIGAKWTIVPLHDSSFVKIGTVQESCNGDINAFVDIAEAPGRDTIELLTSHALFKGMTLIANHIESKQPKWRKDFGQI